MNSRTLAAVPKDNPLEVAFLHCDMSGHSVKWLVTKRRSSRCGKHYELMQRKRLLGSAASCLTGRGTEIRSFFGKDSILLNGPSGRLYLCSP